GDRPPAGVCRRLLLRAPVQGPGGGLPGPVPARTRGIGTGGDSPPLRPAAASGGRRNRRYTCRDCARAALWIGKIRVFWTRPLESACFPGNFFHTTGAIVAVRRRSTWVGHGEGNLGAGQCRCRRAGCKR